jgi:hypothetical protein
VNRNLIEIPIDEKSVSGTHATLRKFQVKWVWPLEGKQTKESVLSCEVRMRGQSLICSLTLCGAGV